MDNEELFKQRVKYLLKEGGVYHEKTLLTRKEFFIGLAVATALQAALILVF